MLSAGINVFEQHGFVKIHKKFEDCHICCPYHTKWRDNDDCVEFRKNFPDPSYTAFFDKHLSKCLDKHGDGRHFACCCDTHKHGGGQKVGASFFKYKIQSFVGKDRAKVAVHYRNHSPWIQHLLMLSIYIFEYLVNIH